MPGISYEDFVDTGYLPSDSDLVCEFAIEPAAGLDMVDAAGRVASESSNGTWATLDVSEDVVDLSATAFRIEDGEIAVAYPRDLFEGGNMAQILSCIAGNIMGMKAVDAIRLLDVRWPEAIVETFRGPQFGSAVKSEFLDAGDRPALATVPKPKVGLTTDDHVEIARRAWLGGIDLLKDDENLTNQSFNGFEDRLTHTLEMRDRVEEETGDSKGYLVNITANADEMKRRADLVAAQGGDFVMVDVVTTGWAAVASVREHTDDLDVAIHAHRAMHAAFDRVENHGVAMRVLAQIARLVGVDHIHTGTANLGKLANEDTVGINDWLADDLYGLNDVLPVASGGLHPGTVKPLLDRIGTNVMIQAGGGVHGHPDGTEAGARAFRQAVDAYRDDVSPDEYAEDHPELAAALDNWGTHTPR
ncbi:type III ribulose-bisphosphate carboxylase [Halanaeroarchaeum sulfurireducens]|uniref:Ribulose bisphosphate carboxylase n=1 Tax=Halanaeroarchaeum sulfurireducens TaxID=1604004 RepID=A0A0F7P998_9EURY|nr:type III ribulose-bisphosphate carboxylase [Halanaeroarchaeum sulfurireducens]AKH97706.1 ribulose-bisphosphate carboxylase large subunit [Halanaeroarchaeum sulfurireducens]ALG82101.1 ribulose-bisphosphate carboxylase large subunit [Halanaeroarchaeum sulfurireducens]